MEPRKVIIIDNKNQSQKVIANSTATTLGELKREMRERGISYEGNTFYCGQMRAELKDDAAPLPETVMYRGQEVRDLTFMLTAPEKKIKSGAMSRPEAYAKIKELGLQDECKKRFGKNFTQCGTTDLEALIAKHLSSLTPKAEAPVEEPEVAPEVPAKEESSYYDSCPEVGNATKAMKVLLEDLYGADTIEEETYDECMAILEGKKVQKSEKMSKKDIDEMFSFVER